MLFLLKPHKPASGKAVLENYTAISCTNNIDILSFISVMLLSVTGQLWRDKN
jgi:hypothetical protein